MITRSVFVVGILSAVIASLAVSYLIAAVNVLIGPLVILGITAVFIVTAIILDFSVGVYVVFMMGIFMSFISRLVSTPIPLGIVYDSLIIITFLCLFLNRKMPKDWSNFDNIFTLYFIIITVYLLLQFFNPNAVSLNGWLISMRSNTSFLSYIIFFHMFSTTKNIKNFTAIWLGAAVLVALYGIFQEIFGLTGFEMRSILETPGQYELYFQWGHMRKFSFLSDPSIFGLFMGFSALAFIALIFGPYNILWKLVFGFSAGLSLLAMLYSGTRTATILVAIGLLFLILLNINNTKVIIFTVAVILVTGFVLVGPFYSGTVIRLRSTFSLSKDPSMSLRDNTRIRFQDYIRSHPIGGGLLTTGVGGLKYSPEHPLAKGWDPDSGYLATALELGWIGLIIFISLFAIAVIKGITNHFSLADPLLRNLNLSYIVPFFALSIAHFAQYAMFSKPVNIVVLSVFALLFRLPQLDKLNYEKST